METIKQIKDICNETDNNWFLGHLFPRVALLDLERREEHAKKFNDFIFYEPQCDCDDCVNCHRCGVERNIRKDDMIEMLGDNLRSFYVYDHDKERYYESVWIFAEKINNEIPGFILLKKTNNGAEDCTHELNFACVKRQYRKMGILKSMLNKIPKEWNVWLEASSKEIDAEEVWSKCGFSCHKTFPVSEWDYDVRNPIYINYQLNI